jgi:hypothetical protein
MNSNHYDDDSFRMIWIRHQQTSEISWWINIWKILPFWDWDSTFIVSVGCCISILFGNKTHLWLELHLWIHFWNFPTCKEKFKQFCASSEISISAAFLDHFQ